LLFDFKAITLFVGQFFNYDFYTVNYCVQSHQIFYYLFNP